MLCTAWSAHPHLLMHLPPTTLPRTKRDNVKRFVLSDCKEVRGDTIATVSSGRINFMTHEVWWVLEIQTESPSDLWLLFATLCPRLVGCGISCNKFSRLPLQFGFSKWLLLGPVWRGLDGVDRTSPAQPNIGTERNRGSIQGDRLPMWHGTNLHNVVALIIIDIDFTLELKWAVSPNSLWWAAVTLEKPLENRQLRNRTLRGLQKKVCRSLLKLCTSSNQ